MAKMEFDTEQDLYDNVEDFIGKEVIYYDMRVKILDIAKYVHLQHLHIAGIKAVYVIQCLDKSDIEDVDYGTGKEYMYADNRGFCHSYELDKEEHD